MTPASPAGLGPGLRPLHELTDAVLGSSAAQRRNGGRCLLRGGADAAGGGGTPSVQGHGRAAVHARGTVGKWQLSFYNALVSFCCSSLQVLHR